MIRPTSSDGVGGVALRFILWLSRLLSEWDAPVGV